MFQSFSLAANSHARHPLHQFEGMAVALDTAEDRMQARHPHPGGMEVVDPQNATTYIGPRLHQDQDLLFVLGHTPLDPGHRRRAEVVLAQTRGITDAGARATAATVTAVEVAVQTGTEATTEIKL
ncbi:ATPase AAA-type core [Penicillium cf. griseofulvum]|uniref:ATPase AAA-type core n=1 Tax=Penicillium cf. griseofulvum TaxID=2972120 RepID=A0A9W9T2L1_9EURO|nr:ATPase AAA-type core [Penicillium cf. griseofulvum]KAJ5446117.1 ATPase AAA-type core [Penicillium cf. griseofulvum]KAJ5447858.1 ATPase AAA-type core [Penicillium cf. griseofulvum]